MARRSRQADLIETLEDQIAALRGELDSLRDTASRRGRSAYGEARSAASDFYDQVSEQFADALPRIRKNAHRVERHARDNPAATAAIGLVALGVLAALVMRRSD